MKTIYLYKIILIITVTACSENVKSEYSNYSDAEAHRLFDEGWLPLIIPKSSEKIKINNDLDLNTSEGSFVYGNYDLKEFLSHLVRVPELDINHHEAYRYEKWIFYIHVAKLQCKYRLIK